MKKALYALVLVLALIFVFLYVILFTAFGNKILASYIENTLRNASHLDLNLSRFELRFSSLDIVLDIANMAQVQVEGNLSLFSLAFDLNYNVSLDKNYAQTMKLKLDENLNFTGKIKGKISDFNVDGSGAFFGSNVNLQAKIFDYYPILLEFSANGIKIEELLKILSKPQYAKGSININADINTKDLKAEGNAFINLATSSINYALIERDFNLTLPQSNLTININAFIQDKILSAKTQALTSYMNFETQNTSYNLNDGLLNSDYTLNIADLSKLEKLSKIKLKGALNLDGNVSLKASMLQALDAKIQAKKLEFIQGIEANDMLLIVNAKAKNESDLIEYNASLNSKLFNINSLKGSYALNSGVLLADLKLIVDDLKQFKNLAKTELQGKAELTLNTQLTGSKLNSFKANANIAGGSIEAHSDGKSLDLNINNLDLTKSLALATQAEYLSGNLNAKAHLSSLDLTQLNGNYTAWANGIFGQKALSAMLGKTFPAKSKYDLTINGDIKNSIITFVLNLKSDLANINDFKGNFDLNNAILNSNFILDAYDFSKLSFLAERKLSGKALFTGNLIFDKVLNLSLNSENLFEGKLKANLANNDFKAYVTGVDFSALMKGLDFPDYYEGKAAVILNYNLLSSSGSANANLSNAKLKNVGIIKTASSLTKSDLTKDSFEKAVLKAQFNSNQIQFDLDMQSARVNIAINSGSINAQNSTLNLPLSLSVDKAKFKGAIKGTSSNPSISIDVGSVIKSGVQKLLENQGSGDVQKGLNKLLDKLF